MLVGFARAIGDAALVSTIHDVAVLPELQGRGIGAALVERLTLQVRWGTGGNTLFTPSHHYLLNPIIESIDSLHLYLRDSYVHLLRFFTSRHVQLYGMDIIDIGTVVPKSLEGFMVSCNFGDDSEESITMRLTPEGAQRYLQRGSGAEGSARERVSKLPPLVLEELETLISSK